MRSRSNSGAKNSTGGGGDAAARADAVKQHVLAYAALHWAIVPCRGKKAGKGWDRAKPEAADTVAGKWSVWATDRNVAIVTGASGLAVVDIDGVLGEQTLSRVLNGTELPAAPAVRTAHGRHIYFSDNSDGQLRPQARDGRDIRAGSSYAVAPPSEHPDTGRPYEWERPPWEIEPPPLPPALLEHFTSSADTSTAAQTVELVIGEGSRRDTLFKLACSLRHKGLVEHEILARDVADRYEAGEELGHEQSEPLRLEVLTARELCELPDPPETDQLLGPLVVRGQRLVLGAHTGEGKSTMALQIIRAVVTGESFLEWQGCGGTRALFIDAEQGLRSIKRRLREAGLADNDQLDFVRVPDGLALDQNPRHVNAVSELLEHGNYGIVTLDPLYKLHAGDSNEERAATDLMRTLDGWRERHQFALLLPTHCRKPMVGSTAFTIHDLFGSTAYLRGAEVVLGLQRKSDGYARLHFLKDRDGDLPIGTTVGLLFDREHGYRIDPSDGEPKKKDVALAMLATDPTVTDDELIDATGVTQRTVQRYRREFEERLGTPLKEPAQ